MSISGHFENAGGGERLVVLIDIPVDECKDAVEMAGDAGVVVNTGVIEGYLDEDEDEDDVERVRVVSVPDVFSSVDSRAQYVLEVLREDGVVDVGDEVGLVAQLPVVGELVSGVVDVSDGYMDESIRELFFASRPSLGTIVKTLEVAVGLARTGQKGDPVGALFVVGDEDVVMDRSRPLNHNPFSGTDVHISDDVVGVSIGEFSKLDGAFVISDTGRVVSASRYLEPRVHDAEVPSGLGARHMAASGITKATDAVSIVVSESDQRVRCFVDGEIVVDAAPEDMDLIS